MEHFGIVPVSHHPFRSHVACLAECLHVNNESIRPIDELTDSDATGSGTADVVADSAEGVGAFEAPHGILYDHYEYDMFGTLVKANCVIPPTRDHTKTQDDVINLAAQAASGETRNGDRDT